MGCGSSSAATPVHVEGAYGVVDLHPSGAVKPCKEFVVMDDAEKQAGSRKPVTLPLAPGSTSRSTPDQDVAAQCVTENAGGRYSKAQALAAASSCNSQGTMGAHASASFTSKRAFGTSAPMFASDRRFGSQGRLY